MTVLALPRLGDIPHRYVVPAEATWVRTLLLSLLDAAAVAPEDFAGRPQTMGALLKNVLRRHWLEITRGERIFRWNLGASHEQRSWDHADPGVTWLTIAPPDGEDDPWPCPTVFVGAAIGRLEAVAEGLGQTVLATFYEALRYLPNTLTPQDALWQAEFVYWHGLNSETEMVEEMMAEDGKTVEQIVEELAIFRRADFFAHMPEWVVSPQRVLTDAQVRRAARRDTYAREVVAAVDVVWRTVCQAGPFAGCSCRDSESDSVAWIAWFRWSKDDAAGRILDDWANEAMQGEFIEAASAVCCAPGHNDAAQWLQRMRSTARLARAMEPLVDLLGAPTEATARVRVQVAA